MKNSSKATGLAGLLVASFATRVLAMEAAPGSQGQAIEEITVTGQRSLLMLRQQVSEAEDVMYGLYNELNKDDQYDIVCTLDTRVFSHIKEKTCLPVYAREALMEEAQNQARGMQGQSASGAPPLQAVLSYEYPRLDARFKEMVEQNPELFDAVAKHYELRETWRLRRKTYFGNDDE